LTYKKAIIFLANYSPIEQKPCYYYFVIDLLINLLIDRIITEKGKKRTIVRANISSYKQKFKLVLENFSLKIGKNQKLLSARFKNFSLGKRENFPLYIRER